MFREFNNLILKQAGHKYIVADQAPNSEVELFNGPKTLVVWSGASDGTIWADKRVNWAFRALHDRLHLKTRLNFNPKTEIELGRIQANQYTGLLADLIYIESAGQADYYLKNGVFVSDQLTFTLDELKKLGYSNIIKGLVK